MKVKEESEKSWLKAQHSENKDPSIWSHHFMANRWGGNSDRLYLLGLQKHYRWRLQPWNYKTLTPRKKSYDQPRQCIKKQRYYFANEGPSRQSYSFSSSPVWIWELHYKESWAPKNCCFWTVVLEKTLESPLDSNEIQPVSPKGNQLWIFIGRTDAEAKTPIFWPPDAKNWLIWKDPDAGKDWREEEKGTTEDEMVGWHDQLNAHESGWTLGVGDGPGGLVCCDSWIRKELDTTERLNWTELMLGNIEDGRRRGRQRMRWLDGITNTMGISMSKL